MRAIAAVCLVLLFAETAPAQEKAKRLLVGKWAAMSGGMVRGKLEFTRDGKMIVQSGRLKPLEFTYKVLEDDTIETSASKGAKPQKRTIKVSKDELEIETGTGDVEKYKRDK